MSEDVTSWVYDGVEVIKTGRVAQNTTRSGKPLELVEVTPPHRILGMWKKWVKESELYKVVK